MPDFSDYHQVHKGSRIVVCDVPIPILRTTAIVPVTRWICTWATKKEEVDKWYDIIEDQSMMNSMT
jgi:hypothetical protein